MKTYQSSYVFKQIKKKEIAKKIHMDFPYGISIHLDTRVFLQFLDFDKLLSTNFSENMNSALPSNIERKQV